MRKHHEHHHPHHHPHHHHRRLGEELIGKPDDTLKNFLTDPAEFGWVIKKIINEGPPPKQIRNAILIKVLSELVKTVTVATGKTPEPVTGIEVESDDPENDDYTYPVQLSNEILAGIKDTDDLLEYIEEGPPHDVLRDILMMAAIKWMNEALNGNGKINSNEK